MVVNRGFLGILVVAAALALIGCGKDADSEQEVGSNAAIETPTTSTPAGDPDEAINSVVMCEALTDADIEQATGKNISSSSPEDVVGPSSCNWFDASGIKVAAAGIERDSGITEGADLLIDGEELTTGPCDSGAMADEDGTTIVRCLSEGYDYEINVDAPLSVAVDLLETMQERLALPPAEPGV